MLVRTLLRERLSFFRSQYTHVFKRDLGSQLRSLWQSGANQARGTQETGKIFPEPDRTMGSRVSAINEERQAVAKREREPNGMSITTYIQPIPPPRLQRVIFDLSSRLMLIKY